MIFAFYLNKNNMKRKITDLLVCFSDNDINDSVSIQLSMRKSLEQLVKTTTELLTVLVENGENQ